MARKKKAAKAKAKPAAKKRETRRPSAAQPAIDDESEEMQDPMAVGIVVMTGVFLVAAIVVNMLHLGHFGVGPFK